MQTTPRWLAALGPERHAPSFREARLRSARQQPVTPPVCRDTGWPLPRLRVAASAHPQQEPTWPRTDSLVNPVTSTDLTGFPPPYHADTRDVPGSPPTWCRLVGSASLPAHCGLPRPSGIPLPPSRTVVLVEPEPFIFVPPTSKAGSTAQTTDAGSWCRSGGNAEPALMLLTTQGKWRPCPKMCPWTYPCVCGAWRVVWPWPLGLSASWPLGPLGLMVTGDRHRLVARATAHIPSQLAHSDTSEGYVRSRKIP